MKYLISSALVILTLTGCSSATAPLRQSATPVEHSGGNIDDTKTSLYWLTERANSPESSSDHVAFKNNTWYRSHYSWDNDVLREMTRTGERLSASGETLPYQVTLRFSGQGEAVYQRLRLDGKVRPMNKNRIAEIKQQANDLLAMNQAQEKKGLELIQGYWKEGVFMTCEGKVFKDIKFKHQLPPVVVERLRDEENFAAFVGEYKAKSVMVDKLLILQHGGAECIERPVE
ncbi:hypothetical protein A9264_11630 [Vibrio sp. UCD-FRSSP16_10]|uniref:DUF1481 domain-containing protein n=1 Tax=unclassified Vibrio TaxID=2614977 RepID=UPI0008012EAF|nr:MULTISPECIES: DUF1481 domain-containing protein [unclassified Vibrio]OBT16455.1 hypothetical protein A9260_11840 [Vibrio sp. UCD-FRSSP16_30]OBT21320.1 hypothetical protein A9264_11630 [Vibrio sp. UCD-FRSSP16_10]